MKLFPKRTKRNIRNDQLAGRMAKFIISLQTAFAGFMSHTFNNRSATSLKWILCMFLLCGSSLSVYIVYNAFLKQNSKMTGFGHLTPPQHFDKSYEPYSGEFITKQEYGQLKRFHQYMDSLQKSKSKIYDSIIRFRPGLPDSIKLLESFYNSQFQNQK